MSDKSFMTMAQFSRHLGVSRPAVLAWRKKGYLVFTADGKRLDVEKSIASLKTRPPEFRGGKAKGPHSGTDPDAPDLSLAESTRRRQAAMAALAELELVRLRGEYLSKDEIRETWSRLATASRSMHLSYPSRAAFSVPTLTPHDRNILLEIARDDCADAALGRGYFSLVKAEDAADLERELSRLRAPLMALPEQLADGLVGRSREAIRDALREAVLGLLDTLSAPKGDSPNA
jgi:hypothetical protein